MRPAGRSGADEPLDDTATLELRAARAASRASAHAIYLGHGPDGWCFARPEHAVLVLGPPRSGKTSSLLVPNVLAAEGAVIATSTKPDVARTTGRARAAVGDCLVFDPTGTAAVPRGMARLSWSPLQTCDTWDGAQLAARRMLLAGGAPRWPTGAGDHWTERAGALVAPLLHAAALEGADLATVLSWVDRRRALPAQRALAAVPGPGAAMAADLLDGLCATDERELSGIWSTASGAFAGYRGEAALATTRRPDFDPDAFVASGGTIYVWAEAGRQALVAPMVVGLVDDVRVAAYRRAAGGTPPRPPVLLALDEVANIAPLPDLPAIVSEGGGQGVLTLACLQDLSQARQRWGVAADGFASLFGTTVVLPGIGDVHTLRALSTLAGDEEVVTRSVSATRVPTGHPALDVVTGGRLQRTLSASAVVRPRLPADAIGRGRPGHALAFGERNAPAWVPLAPAHQASPWRELTAQRARDAGPTARVHQAGPTASVRDAGLPGRAHEVDPPERAR